ncbi:helix-turn-helix domain-containing protein [Paenibacillus sp. GYB003]|uniref:helix-turn-helix domain-containing protein n=1 Tax=Paenibacillus sp. GYB003 TaxID=2994392 RepID=UPI002F96D406
MKRNVFVRLLLHLTLAMVLVTIVSGTVVYGYMNRMLKREVYASNVEVLGQTRKIVENALAEVQQTASSLALNKDVQRAASLDWDMNEEYRFLEAINGMFRDRVSSSRTIHSIYLYSVRNGKIISDSGIAELSGFWHAGAVETFRKETKSSSWYDTNPVTYAEGTQENVLSYMMSVPLNSLSKTGVLVVNLKEDLLYNAVVNTNNRKLGNVAILNADGNVLSYKDKRLLFTRFEAADAEQMKEGQTGYFIRDLNGTETFVSYITSDMNGWQYVTFNPAAEVFKQSRAVLGVTLTVSGLCFAIGLALMIVVSGRYYSPIKRMVQAIALRAEPPASYKDEFSFIRGSFDRLWNLNEQFREKLRENEIVMREHVLLHLLLGKQTAYEDVARELDEHRIPLKPERVAVLALQTQFPEEADEAPELNRKLLRYRIVRICEDIAMEAGGGVVMSQVQQHDVVVLNFPPDTTRETAPVRAKTIARSVQSAIFEQTGLKTSIGIGGYYEKATDVALSYREAIDALLLERMSEAGGIAAFQDLLAGQADRGSFIACRGQADKLIVELKSGNLEAALQIKNEIVERLRTDDSLGYHYKQMILNHIVNGLITVVFELNGNVEDVFGADSNMVYDYGKQTSLTQIGAWFDRMIEKTHAFIQRKRDHKTADFMDKVTAYIRRHSREPLSVQSVAETVFMSGNYFSKLFKEATGKTFVEYVTEVRLGDACAQLTGTDKTIADIAEASGFGTKLNLIRAFRKHYGVTPTEYRKNGIASRLENG